MTRAAQRSKRKPWAEVSVILLDDPAITDAHLRCFGRPHNTDVISQAYRPDPSSNAWSGDILINVAAAYRRTADRTDAGRELALYVAHGCDHLVGGRDDTPARRRAMLARNHRALVAARRAKLTLDLFARTPARTP